MKTSTIIAIICTAIGVIFSFLGLMFRILHWPGAFLFSVLGGIIIVIGVVILALDGIKKS